MGGTFVNSAPLLFKTLLTFPSASVQLAGGSPLIKSPILFNLLTTTYLHHK